MSKPKPTADMWEQLEALNATMGHAARPGPEWFTLGEYADRMKITRPIASHRIRMLVNQGKLERNVGPQRPLYFRLKR